MLETTINGRTYRVEEMPTGANLARDLTARGWDGKSYALHGKRGACALAFRCATTGRFEIIKRV